MDSQITDCEGQAHERGSCNCFCSESVMESLYAPDGRGCAADRSASPSGSLQLSGSAMILTEEQRAFQDIARRFAQERLAPGYMTREREAVLDRSLVREMGGLGLVGPDMPAAFGGIDASGVVSGIIMEEIAAGDFNVGYVQLLASLVGGMLVRHAAEALVADWVPRIVAGTAIVGLALTEPRGGSDAANLVLRAERRGEHFVLNGEKNSISFADQADAFVVFARTGGSGGGAHGVSAFFVPADSPGLGRTR